MLLGGAQIWMCWTERLVLCGVSAHHLRICVSAQSDSAGLEHGLSLAFVTSLQVVPVLLVTGEVGDLGGHGTVCVLAVSCAVVLSLRFGV